MDNNNNTPPPVKKYTKHKMKELSVIKCRSCKVEHTRMFIGYYPNNKDKKWIDPNTGVLFNGKLCPNCHRKSAIVNKLRRKKAKQVFFVESVTLDPVIETNDINVRIDELMEKKEAK